MAELPKPNSLKLKCIWVDRDGKFHGKNIYFPGEVQVDYDEDIMEQIEDEIIPFLAKILTPREENINSSTNMLQNFKQEICEQSQEFNKRIQVPRIKEEMQFEAESYTAASDGVAHNDLVLPSLKLKIKKEVKCYSNEDGSQVIYNDYITSHSGVESKHSIPALQTEKEVIRVDWDQIDERLGNVNNLGSDVTFSKQPEHSFRHNQINRGEQQDYMRPLTSEERQELRKSEWSNINKRLEFLNGLTYDQKIFLNPNYCTCQNKTRGSCRYCWLKSEDSRNTNKLVPHHLNNNKVGMEDGQRKKKCKSCEKCMAEDCRECKFCVDMIKYGGPGALKQGCKRRVCLYPIIPRKKIEKIGSDGNSPKTASPDSYNNQSNGNEYNNTQERRSLDYQVRSNEFQRHKKQFHGERNGRFIEKKDRSKKYHQSVLWKASKKMYNSNFRAYV